MKKKIILVLVILSFFICPQISLAEAGADTGITLTPDYTQTKGGQVDTDLNYFQVQASPNTVGKLSFEITNNFDSDKVVQLDVKNATTGPTGEISYVDGGALITNSYPSLEKVFPEENEITLAAGESQTITFDYQFPEENFNGILLGSVVATYENQEGQTEKTPLVIIFSNDFT
ncbi:WxL protein peptidoglycan domain-containing protein [Enterococcus sp. LJL90]